MIYRNLADQAVFFELLALSTGTPVVGGVVTAYVTKDDGAQTLATGTTDSLGNGQWRFNPSQADTDGDTVGYVFRHPDALSVAINVTTVPAGWSLLPGTPGGTRTTTLWGLAAVKAALRVSATVTTRDMDIARIADQTSAFLERATGRVFVSRSITEIQDGSGGRLLFLHHFPVVSVSSVTVLRSPSDAVAEPMLTSDYRAILDRGEVHAHSDVFTRGKGNVTVVYTAGYGAQDAVTLPADVVGAGLDLLKIFWDLVDKGVMPATSVSVGSLGTMVLKEDWPRHIKDTIEVWHRPGQA